MRAGDESGVSLCLFTIIFYSSSCAHQRQEPSGRQRLGGNRPRPKAFPNQRFTAHDLSTIINTNTRVCESFLGEESANLSERNPDFEVDQFLGTIEFPGTVEFPSPFSYSVSYDRVLLAEGSERLIHSFDALR